MLDYLGEGGTCPECQGGFVEESANAMALAEAVHWIVSEDHTVNSTEARISNLLEDLREHLASVEGLRGGLTFTMDIPSTPKLEPAPQEVRDGIMEVRMDAILMKEMRQAPQCVVCCSDFEVGELLNQLPGCGHLFHSGCIVQWLERAANCPICRCDLCQAVGVDRNSQSTASSVLLDTDRSQYTTGVSTSPSLSGTVQGGFGSMDFNGLAAHPRGTSPLMGYHRRPTSRSISQAPELITRSVDTGDIGGFGTILGTDMAAHDLRRHRDESHSSGDGDHDDFLEELGSLVASPGLHRIDVLRPTVLHLGEVQGNVSPPPPPPPRRGTSSVLVGAGSAISSPTHRPVRSSTSEGRPLSRPIAAYPAAHHPPQAE